MAEPNFQFEMIEKRDQYEKIFRTDDLFAIFSGVCAVLAPVGGQRRLSGVRGEFEFGIEGGVQVLIRIAQRSQP